MVIFLFGLEALLTRDSRVLACAVSFSPKLQAAIGHYSDQTQFLLAPTVIRPVSNPLVSTCGPWENTALLKCRHPHCVALSFYQSWARAFFYASRLRFRALWRSSSRWRFRALIWALNFALLRSRSRAP